ncbi:MAG: peptide chain release factor 1 [Saprospiraceae bacterium]
MIEKLEAIKDRFHHLEEQMADPGVLSDMDRYKKVSKEYKDLKAVVDAFDAYKKALDTVVNAKELLREDDEELRQMAQFELDEWEPRLPELEEALRVHLMPKDMEDTKDVLFEIRSGTGGDEASLFAGDLYRMYTRYFDEQGWEVETISVTEGTVGGYSKLVLEIHGNEVYGKLKFESGAHRVQRVPKTESQGRIHTSAATVVVMPILEVEDVEINRADLKIDVYRASGAGGQHVNRTESAVRITHLPTGVVTESQEARSQHQNKEIAMLRLISQVQEMQRAQVENEVSTRRRSLVGSGDRSDKVRTYNWPQNRVTDHRLEGDNKNFNLDKIMEGDIGGLIEALQIAENAERMKGEAAA